MSHISTLITNRNRAKQLLSFDDMQYGRCRPTDIDLSMDFQGKAFVFGELKMNRVPLTLGQKLHLQALVNAILAGGKKAVAVLAWHDTHDTDGDVHVAQAHVAEVYRGARWEMVREEITLDNFINSFYNDYKNTGVQK